MKPSLPILVSSLLLFLSPFAVAQSGVSESINAPGVQRLADIMSVTQLRHIKLWFAGKSSNWKLADYELQQFRASLVEAASLYPGIPVTNVTMMADPVQAVADAIKAKNSRAFANTFVALTDGCNACHRSMGLDFIVVKIPTTSPFSDQAFPPPGGR
ncbi:hypothetical protein PY365_06010 [Roseiarcaceae bacterium H3SJ34-1]|uniref:hypothetical protein n=1 Tax=Terripilifer ovatus TaxID=3032367 RepID=UPI003AB9328A|nr:hypothetical protein [Roseiarcaceae bacterium H3SJ34-1]